jgi:biofilm PGA synthesis N-glycosyltransferase PgaC
LLDVGLLYYAFTAISAMYILHFGLYLAGANLYDIRQFKRKHHYSAKNISKLKKYPLITIAIPAHNEEKVIIRCLESIRQSNYPNIQVIIADDGSRDGTGRLVRSYIRQHPKFDLSIYRMRKNIGKGRALNYVLSRYARGELAMTIDADSVVIKNTVRNAVRYFEDDSVVGIAANIHIIDEVSVLGMLQKFEHMVSYRSKKVYTMLNCEFIVGGVASTYRMDTLRMVGFYDTDTVTEDIGLSIKIVSSGNRAHKIIYASDVVALTEGVSNFRSLVRQRYRWKYGFLQNFVKYRTLFFNRDPRYSSFLTMYRLPVSIISELSLLVSPLVWGFVLYMTISQRSANLIVGAYLTITAYTFITLWFDDYLDFLSRMRLTLYVPIAYFIYYIMDIVQIISICRCMFRAHHLINHKDVGSIWVSPRRVGREVDIA